MPRTKASYERKEAQYFDRLLAKHIPTLYPEFVEGKIPKDFMDKVILDSNLEYDGLIADELNSLGIQFQDVAYYVIISQEDYNLIKLVGSDKLKKIDNYKAKDIAHLLLNEINKFFIS